MEPVFTPQEASEECLIESIELTDEDKAYREFVRNEDQQKIMELLEDGPISCREMYFSVHAASANVSALRKKGWDIQTIYLKNKAHYNWTGKKRTVISMPSNFYGYYLKSKHWESVRNQRLIIDDYRCCQCKSTEKLQVHHWVYNLFQEHPESELMTLCESCHQSMHAFVRGAGIRSPEWVDKWVFEKLADEFPILREDYGDRIEKRRKAAEKKEKKRMEKEQQSQNGNGRPE